MLLRGVEPRRLLATTPTVLESPSLLFVTTPEVLARSSEPLVKNAVYTCIPVGMPGTDRENPWVHE